MKFKEYISSERGNSASLSKSIGVSMSFLSQMASGDAAISPQRCVAIERATNGQVTRQELRPNDWMDIWPELSEKAA